MVKSRTRVVFSKEMREIRNSRILLMFIVPPVAAAIIFLRDILFVLPQDQIIAQANFLIPFFGLLLPITMAAMLSIDSFVGERNRRTIEPLLVSPVTERELFVGKAMAAFFPSIIITWIFDFGMIGGLGIVDPTTIGIGLSSASLVRILWQAPILALLITCISTLVSSKVADTRVAFQVANYSFLGIFFLFGFGEIVSFGNILLTLLLITIVLSIADFALLAMSSRYFTREELMKRT